MASDITISSLTAVGGLGQIALSAVPVTPLGMTCLTYMQPAGVEFWASSTNNRGAASAIGTSDVGILVHGGLSDNTTRYYWARAVDPEGNYGAFYPASSTGGVSATTKTVTPGPNSITADMLQDGVISKQKFIPGITPVEIVASLPTNGNYAGRMVFWSGKLYRHTGSPSGAAGFTAAVPTTDLLGQITHTQISTPNLAALSANLGTVTAGTLTANVAYLGAVSAAQISASTLSAITANLGEVTAGTVTGVTFRTAASGERAVISSSNNRLRFFGSSGTLIASFGAYSSTEPKINIGIGAGLYINTSTGTVALASEIINAGNGVAQRLATTANNYQAHALRAQNTGSGGGSGLVGIPGVGGGYAFYAEYGTYGPFTGSHPGLIRKGDEAVPGDILIDVKVIARKGIDDTVTEVARASEVGQRAVIGVLSRRMPLDPESLLNPFAQGPHDKEPSFIRRKLAERFDIVTLNGVGEGQVNVCGRGGDLEPGDFICASDLHGKGQRQNGADGEADDSPRRCTVARVRERVKFSSPDEVRLVSCVYLCG